MGFRGGERNRGAATREARNRKLLRMEQLERRELLASDLWLQRGGDEGHDNYVDADLDPSKLALVWDIPIADRHHATGSYRDEYGVVIHEEVVFRTLYKSRDTTYVNYDIIAMNRETGATIWEQPISVRNNYWISAPSYHEGKIYINAQGHSSNDEEFWPRYYELNADTGAIENEYLYRHQHGSSERPTISGDFLYGPANYYGGMVKLALPGLSLTWSHSRGDVRRPEMAVGDAYAYAFDGEALSLATGDSEQLESPTNYELDRPIVGEGKVVFGLTNNSGIAVFDTSTNELLWYKEFHSSVERAGDYAIGNGIIAAAASTGSTAENHVKFFNANTGEELGTWEPADGSAQPEEVVLTKDYAIIHTNHGFDFDTGLHIIDLDTMQEVWMESYDRPFTGADFGSTEISIVDDFIVFSGDFWTKAYGTQRTTLDSIADESVAEDTAEQSINLTGIGSAGGYTPIQVVAESDNSALIPNPTIQYFSGASTGVLRYTPVPNAFGTAVITVTVEDGGADSDLSTKVDNLTFSRSFTITVDAVNDTPTMDFIADVAVSEDATEQPTLLSGISAGTGESQTLRIQAYSNNTSLIPTPSVNYSSPSNSGNLRWTPEPDQFGSAVITVVVEDGGLDNNLATTVDNLTSSRFYTITVNPVNDAPTLDGISDQTVDEDASQQSTILTGISAGGGEEQPLRVTVNSSNPGLILDPSIEYSGASEIATLRWQPVADQSGTAIITASVEDGGADGNLETLEDNLVVSKSFTVTVKPVNDEPVMNAIADDSADEDADEQTIELTGLSAGGGESQELRISAQSDTPELVENPVIEYEEGAANALLRWTPLPDQFGEAVIIVILEDAGLDGLLSTTNDNGTAFHTFTLTVNSINDPPTLDPIDPVTVDEDAAEQKTVVTGISVGAGEQFGKTVRVTSTGAVISILYTEVFENTADINWKPNADQFGSQEVVVIVSDYGHDGDRETEEDNLSVTRTLTITVLPINDAPTIDQIDNVSVEMNSGEHNTQIAGISTGGGEEQPLRITATSDAPDLIPNPVVNLDASDHSGLLEWNVIEGEYGNATIEVLVEDGGLDGDLETSADNAMTSEVFVVSVDASFLTLSIDETSISENGGTAQATVSRDRGVASALSVNLTSVSPLLGFPDGIIIPEGDESKTFTITGTDDSFAYGTQNVEILATAINHIGDSASLEVVDDDAATLVLRIVEDSVDENAGVSQATISRNTPTNEELVVTLTANADGRIDAPQQITIPIGQATAAFEINTLNNEELEGDIAIEMTAMAEAFPSSVDTLIVLEDEPWGWTNPSNEADVSGDNSVSAIDALLLINFINSGQKSELPPIEDRPEFLHV
ncbi:MAG: Ig-like domain-containing protein [Planctomycetota bacterium]